MALSYTDNILRTPTALESRDLVTGVAKMWEREAGILTGLPV